VKRHHIAGIVSLCAVLLMIGTAMTAAAQTYTPFPTSAPIEPDPWIATNVTKDYQRTGWTTTNFLDDVGALKSIPASLDSRIAEPFSMNPGNMYAPGVLQELTPGGVNTLDTIPSGCATKQWNESACWTKTDTGTPGSSAASIITVDGVGKALRFKHVGATGLSNTTWDLDIVNIASDFAKQRFIVAVGIFQLDSGGSAQVQLLDTAGNNRSYSFEATGTLWQNSTCAYRVWNTVVAAVGAAPAVRFLDERPGDGTFGGTCSMQSNIAKIRVKLNDLTQGAAKTVDIALYALRIDVKQLVWGTDRNGNNVGNMTYQTTRTMATFAPQFTYVQQGHMTVALQLAADDLLPSGTSGAYGGYIVTDEAPDAAANANFVILVHYRFDFVVPKAVNLAWANLVEQDQLRVTRDHFKYVGVNGGDKTILFTCASCKVGTIVTLQGSGIVAGTTYTTAEDVYYTEPEWQSISQVTGGFLVTTEDWVLGFVIAAATLFGGGALVVGLRSRRATLRARPPPP
jgi:hypothetical protein